MKKVIFAIGFIILVMLAAAVFFYFSPLLPDKIAIHWNMVGQADGFGSKSTGLFLFPVIAIILSLLLLWLPSIDPKKENIKLFEPAYHRFVVVFILFLLFIFVLSILWNLKWNFSFNQALAAGLAWFFYEIGKLIGQAKMNYTIGLRTPWTLYCEESWNTTHRIVSQAMIFFTLLLLLGVFFPNFLFLILAIVLILFIGLSLVVSYRVYQKIKKSE